VTRKRLDSVELVRRVHIHQHAFAAKHRNVFSIDDVHAQLIQEISHLQAAFAQMPFDRRVAGSAVDRAQRMISAFGPRYDGIHRIAQGEQTAQEVGRDERHVAGDEDERVVVGGFKCRIETTERAAVGSPIVQTADARQVRERTVADEQNVIGQLAQLVQLPLDDSSSADEQLTFIAAAESARLSAGQNRGANHNRAILPRCRYA